MKTKDKDTYRHGENVISKNLRNRHDKDMIDDYLKLYQCLWRPKLVSVYDIFFVWKQMKYAVLWDGEEISYLVSNIMQFEEKSFFFQNDLISSKKTLKV